MGVKSFLSKYLSKWVVTRQNNWTVNADKSQEWWFRNQLKKSNKTLFFKDHHLNVTDSIKDFQKKVPIRDYEDFIPYIDKVKKGEANILWPGKPLYLAKTSGTTSGVKYIPISKDSIPFHIQSARDALLNYIYQTGNASFLNHHLMFLSGSPELTEMSGIKVGRLSGIVNHHVPGYLKRNQKPSYTTNCIEDWEEKLEAVIEETLPVDMSLISGIPPWVQMYFDRIVEKTGRPIKDVFPEFSLMVYGGVNMAPYRKKLWETIGKEIDSIETYPASEGFIAYQDLHPSKGLLLLLNHGIFYEFVPVEEYGSESPTRLTIQDVELDKNYALIMTTNAGLWAYSIGDTIKFVSKKPYRIVVTGRVKHFISAFGEHVIAEEVDKAMIQTLEKFQGVTIKEFTVAPQVSPATGLPHHEWYIEFDTPPNNIDDFASVLDKQLVQLNIYYKDLIEGNILSTLRVISVRTNGFQDYMRSIGKLGGQNKVPRLSNDRKIAEELIKFRD
ncbi:MAG: GH3 auxin-responsive promoter family protein [Cytophagaceae bacterium]